ncbi:ribonuclease H-like domain-containing protein [Tanacetum coccineum]
MTKNKSYLSDYEEIDGGFVAFGGNSKGGKITGKATARESLVLLKVTVKEINMYSVDLKNVVPQGGLTCLFAKATSDESNLWHRRLGHVNFKTMNKLVRGNLVRGLPSKLFEINQTCVACLVRENQPELLERKNRTLIEAARTMLADSKLPTTFWAEAVNTACYVQNKVLVIKPHNKTPYELFLGRKHALSFMRPFRCHVIILNTIDHLGKIDGKADEGFFAGYSNNSKAFRVFNIRTRIVEENMHVQFSKTTPNIAGSGPNWLFDIDALTKSMNYKPVVAGNQSNGNAGTKACDDAGKARVETIPGKDYILLPLWPQDLQFSSSSKDSPDAGFKPSGEEEKKDAEDSENKDSEVPSTEEPRVNQEKDANINSTNNINTVSPTVNAAGIEDNAVDENIVYGCADDPNMPNLEEIVYSDDDEDNDAEADMNNLNTFMSDRMMYRGIVIMVQGLIGLYQGTHRKGIDYDEMDVQSAFLYEKIEEEVYVCQPPGFEDPDFHDRIILIGSLMYLKHLQGHDFKVFAYMRRQGKDFSRTVTPLLATMLIQSQAVEGADETVHEERGDSMERAATTAISLDAEHDSGNIIRTQYITTLNEPIPQGTGSVSGPRRQDTILRDRHAQTRDFMVQEDAETQGRYGHDTEINTASTSITIASINITTDEPVITASALIATVGVSVSTAEPSTPPPTTTTFIEDQDLTIAQTLMKMRSVKSKEKSKEKGVTKLQVEFDEEVRLEEKEKKKLLGTKVHCNPEPGTSQGRYGHDTEINTASTSITIASINITTDEPVITASALIATVGVSVSTAEPSTPPPTTTTFIEDQDLTIAQTLMKMRSVKSKEKSKEKGVTSETATRLTRGVIMKEAKYDDAMAKRLQVELDEEVRLEREGEEEASNAALIEERDTIEARIDADAQLAERLLASKY